MSAVIAPIDRNIHAPGAKKVKGSVHVSYIYTTVRHISVHCVLGNVVCSVIISMCKTGGDATPNRRASEMTTAVVAATRSDIKGARARVACCTGLGVCHFHAPRFCLRVKSVPCPLASDARNPNKATVRSPDMPPTNRTPRFKVFARHHNAKSTYDHRTS